MDLNKAMIMGHVGKEPTFHMMPSTQTELCKFSVATSRKWKDKQSGEFKEDTSWHNVVIFSPHLVEKCHNQLQKGTRVFVEGEIKTRSYEKEGVTRYITEIVVPQYKGDMWVVEKGKGHDVNENPGADRRYGSGSGGPQHAGDVGRKTAQDFDDDIPF